MKRLSFQPSLQTILFSACLMGASYQTINADELAQKPQTIVTVERFDTTLALQVKSDFSEEKTHTRVAGPNGFLANSTGGKNLDLTNFGNVEDGVYHYEITSPTNKRIKLPGNRLDNGRGEKERNIITVSETQSGFFRIKNGAIVTDTQLEEKE